MTATYAQRAAAEALDRLRAMPRYHSSPVLHAAAKLIERGEDPVRSLCEALRVADEQADAAMRTATKVAERSMPPAILVPASAEEAVAAVRREAFVARHEERLAYRCHACGAPENGAPLRPEEQHLLDEFLRGLEP